MIQNLDNQVVYTNVTEWADGDVNLRDLEDVPVFVAEREDGKLKDVSDNDTDVGKWIYNYFQNDPVTGKNEKIIVSVDVSFPYSDEVSAAYVSYENYAGWGSGWQSACLSVLLPVSCSCLSLLCKAVWYAGTEKRIP